MASKRKSSVPCMIPSKVLCSSEEHGTDSDTPPQPAVSGRGPRSPVDPGESSRPEGADGAGTYTCRLCNFETQDLNLFLDHVYSGHPDFCSDPRFSCVGCGVSVLKFEGLALHNARVHPSTCDTALQLKKKDGRAVVEQNLVTRAAPSRGSEISISKTPIMRMMKVKSEAKRIAVAQQVSKESSSDPGPVSPSPRDPEKKESGALTVVHVPGVVQNGSCRVTRPSAIQIVNGCGSLPELKSPVSRVVSLVHNKSLTRAVTSDHLPKVMIPLNSIPTYSASMDCSSFLKTSFNKFPYPTKAELCYLTVVTRFPEEQIKIWFTAQRLKQGISWSPEEIEEARRKMFNTIIQTAPAAPQNQAHSHHGPAQHTITVLPASLGAAGIPHVLQGSFVSQGGVIVTQPVVANGIQVNSAPLALAVTPKPQAASRPMMQARPAAALVADKGVRMVVGAGGSSSKSNDNRGGAGATASVVSLNAGNGKEAGVSAHVSTAGVTVCRDQVKTTDSSHDNDSDCSLNTDCKHSDSEDNNNNSTDTADPPATEPLCLKPEEAVSPSSKPPSPSAPPSRTTVSSFLDPGFFKSKKSQEQLNVLKDSFQVSQFPDQDQVDRLSSLTGLPVRDVRKWFSDRRYHFRHQKGLRGSAESPSTKAGTGPSSPVDPLESSSSSSSRNSAGGKQSRHSSAALSPPTPQTPPSPTPPRRQPRLPPLDFTAVRYKEREPHQVKALEFSFSQNPDPSREEVDRLRTETKMTRREIHGWFSDRRKKVEKQQQQQEKEEYEKGEEQEEDSLGQLKVNPIKINLKMLKVTKSGGKVKAGSLESAAQPQRPNSPKASASGNQKQAPPTIPTSHTSGSPKATSVRGKKTAEQLHLLKQIYARTQWPSAAQYDQLISSTGLSRPEVVRWFGDCRYVQKNGQLKWLGEYQSWALGEDLPPEKEQILHTHLQNHGRPDDTQLQDLVRSSGLSAELVQHWFTTKAALLLRDTSGATAEPSVPTEPSSTPPCSGGGSTEKVESDCGTAAESTEAEAETHTLTVCSGADPAQRDGRDPHPAPV